MASAPCSSTSIPTRELFCCAHSPIKGTRDSRLLLDDRILLSNGGNRLLFDGKTVRRHSSMKEKRLKSVWTDRTQLLGKSHFNGRPTRKQNTHLIKAVATVEPTYLVPSESGRRCESDMHFSCNSDSQVLQSTYDDSPEMDEREMSRRMKISKANKGNVPWNKGRKHSAETRQRIRERTRIAMQDPKVKMKLVNLGHAQSEETRNKIGAGVREGWQRRREKLLVQERCVFEWQNMIAEASRNGYVGEDELQWDSYKILDEQLKMEWLESVEKRKTMPRVKGSKRAPKSPEQRRKISEAISAKWADPEYRNRVYVALAKYHGTPIGVERKPRKKPTGETSSVKKMATKKKPGQPKDTSDEQKIINKVTPRRKRNAAPSYKDPMARAKLEMIKKIRAKRAAMETKKRQATERAKLLIAEAEKAAKALEVAALTSPLAQASLLETRKLIAEAVRSIESIESGQVRSQETAVETSFYSNGPINHCQAQEVPGSDILLENRQVNGSALLPSSDSVYKDFGFNEFTLHNGLSNRGPLHVSESAESLHSSLSHLQPNILREESSRTDVVVDETKINAPIVHQSIPPEKEEDRNVQAKNAENSMNSAMKTKKWVCGRLVEVEES